MTQKRLDRDAKWGFQGFPYYQMRVETDFYQGLVSLIDLIGGQYYYWDLPKAGKVPVCGKGMKWLQLIPDGNKRAITAKLLPKPKKLKGEEYTESLSVCYADVIEGYKYAEDGVAVFEDKYLDVIFTPEGDVILEDQDELDAAYESGELSEKQYQQAIAEGKAIMEELCTDIEKTEIWFQKILTYVKKHIETGKEVFSKNTGRGKA